jgi:hypothetical protein
MTEPEGAVNNWLALIKSEFTEMPGLCLTRPQIQKLWGLDQPLCDAVIEALLASDFLRVTAQGAYMWTGHTSQEGCTSFARLG